MEGDKIKTNILIAGKSGVGKSSLLNYIFGEEVEKTEEKLLAIEIKI